jgi:DNA-binding transcriptional MerR regulator
VSGRVDRADGPMAQTPADGGGSRHHLSIGEVLSLLQQDYPDITISKIRFLESQGLLDPERTPSGYRKFYDHDVEQLRWVLRQQKENFLPLKVIKDRLASGCLDVPPGESGVLDLAAPPADHPAVPDAPQRNGVPPTGDDASAPTVLSSDGDTPATVAAVPNNARPARSSQREQAEAHVAPLDLAMGSSSVSMSATELCRASGLTRRHLGELERYAMVSPRTVGNEVVYDEDDLVVANLAAAMADHGMEPRHLRMFKIAAEREAGVYEQMVMPRLRSNRVDARREAAEEVAKVAGLADQLHRVLLRTSLKDTLGPL